MITFANWRTANGGIVISKTAGEQQWKYMEILSNSGNINLKALYVRHTKQVIVYQFQKKTDWLMDTVQIRVYTTKPTNEFDL